MGKTALITGSSRGIGRSVALQLGLSGYQVVINGTKQSLIDEVVREVRSSGGVATGYCANVADPLAVTAMVDHVAEKYGRIDVLIHSAGNLHDQKCIRMTDYEWNSVIDVHLHGAFYCTQRVLPYMTPYGGDILFMTSTAGLSGSVGQLNYSAAKAGMLGMVWTLAAELARYQIRVNGISPAALTDMTRPVIEHIKEKCARRKDSFPDFWKIGEPDDVAKFVAALLAQPDQDITGEIFGVNGSTVTRWQKPAPVFSEEGIDRFFAAWYRQKGTK
ncbi:SDR family NAD(P)-dependent oxidoreductase [Paenibacillus polygoni]|uniref:SDR family NAD(P)-dependent oxidoreductase n=1 Tax=Paenibacillus polygoni TaxID=3050112 RepID=A0ABY8WXW1_9BACL|nr:SDR family NAD(P)-dependent oxidoreductase [Paenibacillus polygoni]WIV17503.1 SDR family NAD(P)-dependent oxidoreductase [Paenibacillus polygoni]